MKRTLFAVCMAIAICFGIKAQDTLSWNEGPLKWSDFQGSPMMPDSPSYIAVNIELKDNECQAVMYRENSYASDNDRSPERLRYFQTQFNLAELLACRFQQELNMGLIESEKQTRLEYYQDLYRNESQRLSAATNAGKNEKELAICEDNIRQQLDILSLSGTETLDFYTVRYGLFVGTGFVATTKKISNYFNTAWDFSFGLLVNLYRFGIEGSFTFASPTIKDPYLTKDIYEGLNYYANVKNANYYAIGFNGGYNVIDTKRFLVRPYIGGMWTSYSWTARPLSKVPSDEGIVFDGKQQRMALNDFNLTFGINFEWHFHTAVTSFPFYGSQCEQYISSLRLTPYAIHSNYKHASEPFSGWQVGLTVAYSGVVGL